MVPRTFEEHRQRNLNGSEDGETRARLRDLAEHSEVLVAVAISHERWKWLRSLLGSSLTWAGIALAFAISLKDEILHALGGGAQ